MFDNAMVKDKQRSLHGLQNFNSLHSLHTTTNASTKNRMINKENFGSALDMINKAKTQKNLKDKLFSQSFKVKKNSEVGTNFNIPKPQKANGGINYVNRVNYMKTDPGEESGDDELRNSLRQSNRNFHSNSSLNSSSKGNISKIKVNEKKFQINYDSCQKKTDPNIRVKSKNTKLMNDSAWTILDSVLRGKKKDDYFAKKESQIPAEYLPDILDSLYIEEKQMKVNPEYMDKQKDINAKMRAVIVNWLIDVHFRFKLFPETLFICVNLFDRYLSHRSISRNKLQLLGVACLLVACKYEEIFSPEIRDFVCILDKSYEKEDIIKMEKDLLNTLKFNVTAPSSLKFFEILAISLKLTKKEFFFGKYLLEVTLLDYRMLKFSASQIAATVCYISLLIFKAEKDKVKESSLFFKVLNYPEDLLSDCAMDIFFVADSIANSSYQAVKKKYSSKKMCEVAYVHFLG